MFERLRRLIGGSVETREIPPGDALDVFLDRYSDEIDSLRETGEQKRDAVEDAIADLEDSLDVLASYDGENARVEDVTSNVASRRERAIQQFDPPEDLGEFTDAARELVDDLSHVKQKEKMILDQVGEAAETVFSKVRSIDDAVDDLETFLEDHFDPIRTYRELDDLVDKLDRLRSEREELQEAIDDIDLTDPSEELQEVETKLEDLDEDPEQQQKDELEEEKARLEDDLAATRHRLEEAVSEMERGLRKLLYDIESGDLEVETGHVDVLRDIEDGDVLDGDRSATEIQEAVSMASAHIDEVDIGQRQRERFEEAAETLADIGSAREEMEEIEDSIADIDADIADLTIDERREKLQDERSSIMEEIGSMEREQDQLRNRLEVKTEAIEETKDEIEDLLDRSLRDDVVLVEDG